MGHVSLVSVPCIRLELTVPEAGEQESRQPAAAGNADTGGKVLPCPERYSRLAGGLMLGWTFRAPDLPGGSRP